MFKAALKSKFQTIFDFKKVSYDQPGDSQEQDCLFINIENCNSNIKDGLAVARVTGSAFIYSTNQSLPFGYIAKKIKLADPAMTKDLFFYNLEENSKTIGAIVQRGFSFVYFYSSQYDPVTGTITSIVFEET